MEYDEYGFPVRYNSGYGLGTNNTGSDLGLNINKTDPLALGQPLKLNIDKYLGNMNKVGPRTGSVGSIKFGADASTPNSANFQGVYKGILSSTGEMGWSTDPAAFKAGTVESAVWGDGTNLNFGETPTDGKDGSLLGLSTAEWDNAIKAGQLGIGAGQLGLGIAGYFRNRDIAEKQKEDLGLQIKNKKAEIAARENYRIALGSFGK